MRARYGAIGRGDIYYCQRCSMADYIRAAEAWAELLVRAEQAFGRRKAQKEGAR